MNINKNEYINFLKNELNTIYLKKLIYYFDNKYKNYFNVKSNLQIKTLAQSNKYLPLLKQLLSKNFKHLNHKLHDILINTKSDKQFYKYLNNNQTGGNYTMHLFANKIKKYIINKGFKIKSYLDVGCADGKKTIKLAQYLNINNFYGTDIDNWYDIGQGRTTLLKNKFKLIQNNKLSFQNKQFDLVSCFMILHHIPKFTSTLKEIYRVLKPKGFLIISEHDAFTDYDRMLIDVQHSIYELAFKNNTNYFNNYYGKYYNLYEWHFIMNKFNFKLIQYKHYNISAGPRFNIYPTRYFYAIYQKQ